MADDSIPDAITMYQLLTSYAISRKKKMENFFGSVLNVEKKFLFLKILMIIWKKLGVRLDNEFI